MSERNYDFPMGSPVWYRVTPVEREMLESMTADEMIATARVIMETTRPEDNTNFDTVTIAVAASYAGMAVTAWTGDGVMIYENYPN